MRVASCLAAVLVLLAGDAAAKPAFDEADIIRTPLQFGPSEGDLDISVLTARAGCGFEADDGRRSRLVWLVSRAGKPVAVAPVMQFDGAPASRDGKIRPPARAVLAPVHGALPLADGPEALEARLKRDGWSANAKVSLTCPPPVTPRTAVAARKPTTAEKIAAVPLQAVGVVLFSPVILFGVPAENRSLTTAAEAGPVLADALTPGTPVPGGLDAFAKANSKLVRVLRDPGSDYAVLTVDLGGKPRYGIATPREAAFFGVRNGVVEWRAERGIGIESALCANSRGEFGGRKGCSTTGYYNPRP